MQVGIYNYINRKYQIFIIFLKNIYNLKIHFIIELKQFFFNMYTVYCVIVYFIYILYNKHNVFILKYIINYNDLIF